MRLTDRILGFTLLGSEWVLWVLIGLSLLSVTIMVERGIFLAAGRVDFEALAKELLGFLKDGDVPGARKTLAGLRAPEAQVAAAGVELYDRGSEAMSEAMASVRSRLRLDLERNLGVLGTLGNNAPFIGLFGTVLGIIKAFADLSHNQTGGAAAVMSGISAALVATAVGLMVAIPAVIAFNYFQGKVRASLGRVDAMAHLILSAVAKGK
ncbi:MAG TPA: MotA/TolQ/ExbB proton channel family protein [Polyangia bacterium]|jgi:biopolymer transport protein ExbB|nr:MotA/TolQ/ExbB proton channel family protein [Polyangia bacterium]